MADLTRRPPRDDVVRDRHAEVSIGWRLERDDKRARLANGNSNHPSFRRQETERDASGAQLSFRNQNRMTQHGSGFELEQT